VIKLGLTCDSLKEPQLGQRVNVKGWDQSNYAHNSTLKVPKKNWR